MKIIIVYRFLDTVVVRSSNNTPNFKVYRKPTHSNSYIHAFSNHSDNVKLGVISNIFLRAYKICDMEYLDEELQTIKSSFQKLGYSLYFINKAHSKARKNYYSNLNRQPFLKENENILVLPQTSRNSKLINSSLRKCNILPVYRNTNILRNELTSSKRIDEEKPCIYKINCNNCNKCYIGETIDFERRKKQHHESIRRGDINSSLFHHMQNENHSVNVNSMERIVTIAEVEKRKLVEAVFIQNSDNYNIQRNNYKLDKITSSILTNKTDFIYKSLRRINRPP